MERTWTTRERHGHQVAFGEDTDELDRESWGERLTHPIGVGAPSVTAHDVPARSDEADKRKAEAEHQKDADAHDDEPARKQG